MLRESKVEGVAQSSLKERGAGRQSLPSAAEAEGGPAQGKKRTLWRRLRR